MFQAIQKAKVGLNYNGSEFEAQFHHLSLK